MIVVLGAGIAGISAAYHLKKQGIDSVVFEKDSDWGGLCGNFEVDGYRFDKAIHLSFTENEYVKNIFSKSCNYIIHKPLAFNYYKGTWIKHPAQNNLYPLSAEEKIEIISGFVDNINEKNKINNYEEWLRAQYGDSFSDNFPIPYTHKYWTVKAKDLSTSWVGNRMYKPNIKEVLSGAFLEETPNTYYAKEMRYPVKGGYKTFLNHMAESTNILLDKEVVQIQPNRKKILFKDGTSQYYERLISSIPLPEYRKLIHDLPTVVSEASRRLKHTSVALISIGLNKPKIPKYLWFYIYDTEIYPARCYSPSMKSVDNVPDGCSSLQFEVYFSENNSFLETPEKVIEHVISSSVMMGIFSPEQIKFADMRIINYGNVIYNHGMEKDRKIVRNYLYSLGVSTIGRFGLWAYLWSDQSFISGKQAVKNCEV
jgi:protoporphyrinogen oxidase